MIYIRQQDVMDCGPSCLVMIAKYYGVRKNIDTIRHTCALGKDGVSLLGISKAAEEIGFKTIGGRLDFDALAQKVPLPCVAHWNQNHFVVVYKGRTACRGAGVARCTRNPQRPPPWTRPAAGPRTCTSGAPGPRGISHVNGGRHVQAKDIEELIRATPLP